MIELQIVPEIYQDYYQSDLTRGEAALFVHRFLNMQYDLDNLYDLYRLLSDLNTPRDNSILTDKFQDLDQWSYSVIIETICSLGIMTGVTDTEFKPHSTVSLDEAVGLFLRMYCLYANQSTIDMNKYIEILNLKQIYGDRLSEATTVSREEFLVILYNLYQNAPVSRLHQNVEPLFSLDTLYNYLKDNPIFDFFEEIETKDHVILLGWSGIGMPRWGEKVFILHKNGGMKQVDIYGWSSSHTKSYFTGLSGDQSLLYINIHYRGTDLDTIYTINLNTGHIYKDY